MPGRPPGQGRGVAQIVPVPTDPPGSGVPGDEAAPASDRAVGATITPYRDGPLIVRGDFRLLDQDAREIDPGRETIALCRCGKSGIKPFCDGSHKRAGFSAPSAPSRPRPLQTLRERSRPQAAEPGD